MSFVVAPIVEGHGDVQAVPLLIRRLHQGTTVGKPVRFPKNKLIIPEHLKRAADIAASNITGRGAVLLVMDADEDCAAELGPQLEARLCRILPQHLCRVVLAVREFESWIVGGHSEFDVANPDDAGSLKARIRARFGIYKETVDQPRLIASSNLERLSTCSRSFCRFKKVLAEILEQANS